MSGPNQQIIGVSGVVHRIVVQPAPDVPPADVPKAEDDAGNLPPRAVTRDLNDCATILLAIDAMMAPWPELHTLGRPIQQCRALLAARGAIFPTDVSFEIGISQIGGAGI